MTKLVVVDSDAIFALYNPNDPLNIKALKTFQKLLEQGYQMIYPTSVLFEVISLFQRVLPKPTVTKKLIELIRSEQIPVFTIDTDTLKESAMLFDPAGSRKNTLIDCSVAVVARKMKAEGVFAYDEFYKKQGLKLAENLV
ncbi:hypothetical protein A3C59_05230 [Candidatus Daviesbacteria bacterium RIFCSPHIGHO2_02_FULL_36_13]|uniref:PIN domain-containing protein n=1 Tax=Candidatus Daviesbacteria bacterium RIFCSPHIGHO2_02_FULL_36_13 TaxID=1797768 RepID=A0A1F5JUX2_9BACT|nr:MAG: hypothetical protein A3C59_05230 [Candidatus Daviesbacteria bacterium RIFCSPHIGHO2_02_FULL_36_13]OGE44570.1 MAG: hypothetical protein A3A45_02915 [Candidatus Daviesbacteria bacterium RIFCSPLOWO2_01_FULL_36_8]